MEICPVFISFLSFFLISSQAQRDYFGAHTYELLSNPGHFVHTNWTGHGGSVSSTTYQAWAEMDQVQGEYDNDLWS